MSARSTQISYLCFLLLFSFSAANATEWHRFERDGLALHLAHTDTVRAQAFLNALLIGRNEIRRKLGGAPAIPMGIYLAPLKLFSRINTRAVAHIGVRGLHFSNRAPLFCKPAPTICYRLRGTNLPIYFCTPSRPRACPSGFTKAWQCGHRTSGACDKARLCFTRFSEKINPAFRNR